MQQNQASNLKEIVQARVNRGGAFPNMDALGFFNKPPYTAEQHFIRYCDNNRITGVPPVWREYARATKF